MNNVFFLISSKGKKGLLLIKELTMVQKGY